MSDFRVGSAPGRSFIHVFPDAASRERETEVVVSDGGAGGGAGGKTHERCDSVCSTLVLWLVQHTRLNAAYSLSLNRWPLLSPDLVLTIGRVSHPRCQSNEDETCMSE